MCGRFVRTSPADVIRAEFGVTATAEVDLAPRYNICPGEPVAAIVGRASERRLGPLVWGLGPRAQVNVRTETVGTRSATRDAFLHRRCLVMADGFYEWLRQDGQKVPYFFRLASRRPFAFAGIWSRGDAGERPQTAILTRPADDVVAKIHDRMPVVLDPSAAGRWIDPKIDATAELERLLREPVTALESWRVSTFVNSARNDSPECIRPAEAPLRLVPLGH
jgi:putative SOS response-associated peptidase YedK